MSVVGDAGYCPSPSPRRRWRYRGLAMVGSYVLAGELATAGGDHLCGFRAYEHEIGDYARRSRAFARAASPNDLFRTAARNSVQWPTGCNWLLHLPPESPALWPTLTMCIRLHDSVNLKGYS